MNWIKDKVISGKKCPGLWVASDSAQVVELLGHMNFDWVLLDMEHGFGDEALVARQVQALRSTPTGAVVRVVTNQPGAIKRVLDMGAAGIMVPFVNTVAQARQMVEAMKYPPAGIRGVAGLSSANRFGLDFKGYFSQANDRVLGIVQIESRQGLENVDEIAQVEGVDVVFTGPLDLSVNLGIAAEYENPLLQKSLQQIVQACKRHGKTAGIFLPRLELAAWAYEQGYTFVGIGTELDILRERLKEVRRDLG